MSEKEQHAPKTILLVYHSQRGTMKTMAETVASGAALVENIRVVVRTARNATLQDLTSCHGIAIGSPEYFGYMAGAVKDFFDRTYEEGRELTFRLPYFAFVCAGNDGRGTVSSIERIATGYRWKKIADPVRIVGAPSDDQLGNLAELGQTLAAGVEAGIF